MRVVLRVSMSGTRNGMQWPKRGETVDLPDREAAKLIAAGHAVPVAAGEDRETAVQPRPEVKKRAPKKSTGMTKRSLDGDAESS